MTAWNVQDLLAPLSDQEACGPDLEYSPEFIALDFAVRGKPERQAGSEILAAEPPIWADVQSQALNLAARTRDLRIAVILTRAGARLAGIAGYAAGLALIAGLLERYWDQLHPKLDAAEGNDPTMRLNALAPLVDGATGLGDLRDCLVGRPGSGLSVRLIELAWSKADLLPHEVKPTQPGVLQGLREASEADSGVRVALSSLHASVRSIEQALTQRVGNAGPDLKPLRRLADCCVQAVAQLDGAPAAAGSANGASSAAAERGGGALSRIESRGDVLLALDLACTWIESHEPTNPAPLLIRRAQRLMSKSFMELVRDLAPEGLPQVERIAGVGGER